MAEDTQPAAVQADAKTAEVTPADIKPVEAQRKEAPQTDVELAESRGVTIFQRIGSVLDKVVDNIKEWLSSMRDKAKEASDNSATQENSAASRTESGSGDSVTTVTASKSQPGDITIQSSGAPAADTSSAKFADKVTAGREAQAALAQQGAVRS